MSEPPFKVGDRVVCVNSSFTELAKGGIYIVRSVSNRNGCFVSVSDDPCDVHLSSRFTLEQPAVPEDYPDSVEDYAHNKPHYIIAWGAASLLIWLAFFAGLWMGWAWL